MIRYILIVLLFVMSLGLRAQDEVKNKFVPNIFLGISTSQVDGDTYAGFHKMGIVAGIGVKTKFSEKIGLGIDLSYIQKGAKKSANAKNLDYSYYRLALDYAEVPVYMTYYQDRFIFDLGLSTAFLLSSHEERESGVIKPVDFYKFEDIDFSFLLGFDYRIKEKLKFQVRYSYSVLPFRKSSDNPLAVLPSGQYHSVLMFKIVRDLGQ